MRYRMDRALRHLLLLALISLFPLGLWAEGKVYTPELVPNVFTTDSTRLLSDPESYISAEGRERIDAALYEIRRTTGVEFATVILPSIGEREIESFSTDYGAWARRLAMMGSYCWSSWTSVRCASRLAMGWRGY